MQRFSFPALQETVAFSVQLEGGNYSPAVGEKIPYNNIVTNIGNGYITQRQEFVCPVAGVYAFHATVMSYGVQCKLDLYKNEESIGRMWSATNPTGQGGIMVALELQEVETVSVRSSIAGCTLNGNEMYNTFTGFKIE